MKKTNLKRKTMKCISRDWKRKRRRDKTSSSFKMQIPIFV